MAWRPELRAHGVEGLALRPVVGVDVLTCPHCGGPRRLIAQLTDPIVVRKILAHLGLPTEPPRPAPARSREQLDFA